MDKLSILGKTRAEAYAAGASDSRRFMALYRAYLRGASDAAEQYADREKNSGLITLIAAMVFALLSWSVTMYFVFK